jgi:protein required for attachment to host cells
VLPVGALEMNQDELSRATRSDKAPRVHESTGAARHAIEPRITPHEDAATAFVHRLAEHLNAAARAGRYERLVLFAPPRALGFLRQAIAGALEASFDLDVVEETADQIKARLNEAGVR